MCGITKTLGGNVLVCVEDMRVNESHIHYMRELCHCGEPIKVYKDLNNFTRGLCAECDALRCDAYPGACV